MNIEDGIEVASAVKDVYIICADLPENVTFEIEIETHYDTFRVNVIDRRIEWKHHCFIYHKDMSASLNALGLKEWIPTVL